MIPLFNVKYILQLHNHTLSFLYALIYIARPNLYSKNHILILKISSDSSLHWFITTSVFSFQDLECGTCNRKNTFVFIYVVWICINERLCIIWSITTIFCCKYFLYVWYLFTRLMGFISGFVTSLAICVVSTFWHNNKCVEKPHCYIFGNKIFLSMFMSKFFSKSW